MQASICIYSSTLQSPCSSGSPWLQFSRWSANPKEGGWHRSVSITSAGIFCVKELTKILSLLIICIIFICYRYTRIFKKKIAKHYSVYALKTQTTYAYIVELQTEVVKCRLEAGTGMPRKETHRPGDPWDAWSPSTCTSSMEELLRTQVKMGLGNNLFVSRQYPIYEKVYFRTFSVMHQIGNIHWHNFKRLNSFLGTSAQDLYI